MIEDNVLFNKYRPTDFSEVYGQDVAVKAIENAIAQQTSRQFMFVGPSGTGKTTLARIAAKAYGCENIMEIDGASNTGIDAMREATSNLELLPLLGERRAIILDEAHRLSGNAWDACLKSLEEPPAHVVWFICSTNPAKIPDTVRRRCMAITLKPVPETDISYLLVQIAAAEGMTVEQDIIDICARAASGSPGRGLVNLAKCATAETAAEARELCREASEFPAVPKLCQLLLKGGSWSAALSLINELKGQDNEGVRISICNYFAKVLESSGSKSPDYVYAVIGVLDAFSQQSYRSSDGLAPIYISTVAALWPNGPPQRGHANGQ